MVCAVTNTVDKMRCIPLAVPEGCLHMPTVCVDVSQCVGCCVCSLRHLASGMTSSILCRCCCTADNIWQTGCVLGRCCAGALPPVGEGPRQEAPTVWSRGLLCVGPVAVRSRGDHAAGCMRNVHLVSCWCCLISKRHVSCQQRLICGDVLVVVLLSCFVVQACSCAVCSVCATVQGVSTGIKHVASCIQASSSSVLSSANSNVCTVLCSARSCVGSVLDAVSRTDCCMLHAVSCFAS